MHGEQLQKFHLNVSRDSHTFTGIRAAFTHHRACALQLL
jgi:hypothetical protein